MTITFAVDHRKNRSIMGEASERNFGRGGGGGGGIYTSQSLKVMLGELAAGGGC